MCQARVCQARVCQALVSGRAPGMTDTTRTLQDVLDGMRFAMVATADGAGIWKSRPLALAGDQADVLSFLVSVDADWVTALEDSGSPTTVTFSDPGKNTYVALQGHARAVDDRSRTAQLWNAGAAAYFDGKDDPMVRVLDVTVGYGEYWDGPHGRLGSLVQIASAALGREIGSQGDIAV